MLLRRPARGAWSSRVFAWSLGLALIAGCGGTSGSAPGDLDGGLPDGDDAPPPACGNSFVDPGETCDDGNQNDADGCSKACAVEDGWTCPQAGQPCFAVPKETCGDKHLDTGEECDDGDVDDGDGCSKSCVQEPGWTCAAPGEACTKDAYCGDGVVQGSEACDDGNTAPGDGCSGTCHLEPDYVCETPTPPPTPVRQVCTSTIVCSDGKVTGDEACDDSNKADGDGCAADCKRVESGWTCPKAADGTGGPCTLVPVPRCGDARQDPGEQCDDGNDKSTDGCSSSCVVEPGYTCPTAGAKCALIAYCGDGKLNLDLGEDCDDGDAPPASGDGCSALCKLEPDFSCPDIGLPCVSTVVCGDGKVTGAETCDDLNKAPNDGCSAACAVESGWQCPTAGSPCSAKKCGDGILAGSEKCDDGNAAPNDGCSASCAIEPGYACSGASCHKTTCGDGIKEGQEQCDNKDLRPYDGCSPTCTNEAKCTTSGCPAVCGDGVIFPGEECDDGNTTAGDGCSASCKKEAGFDCTTVTAAPPTSIPIPMLYHDVAYNGTTFGGKTGHPDFERYGCGVESVGLVNALIGADDTPVFARGSDPATLTDCGTQLTGATEFASWFHDDATYNVPVFLDGAGKPLTLTLARQADGTYLYDSTAIGGFFPIDGLGLGNQSDGHNFAFASELHYTFTYAGGEALSFTGDDDVWVFINGRLAVDLGGLHPPRSGTITLDAARATTLGLTKGGMYEFSLFQAERHTSGSNYVLTLGGFVRASSQCVAHCGDKLVVAGEACDEGAANGSGYGHCTAACKLGPRCGDAVLQASDEECDDGSNLVTYGGATKKCGPGCKFAAYCGDGKTSNGEECDEGAANGTGYGHCSAACKLGPRCGDGLKNGAEQCDDGVNNGASADPCDADCTLKCGNGRPDAGEACDDGAANNTGGYGKCRSNCTFDGRCGDGVKSGGEQCDDGVNDGSYGTCNVDCTFAGYCGDGKQSGPEQCDLGTSNQSNPYGTGKCTLTCQTAPYCGDGIVELAFGEQCEPPSSAGCDATCKKKVQ